VFTRSSPVQTICGGTNWEQVSCSWSHAAAVKTDGTLWLWGNNSYGNLGDNTTTSRSSPVQTVAYGNNWKQVSCGNAHTAAIKTDGTLWLWGYNSHGQLGDNTLIKKSSPVQTIAYGTNWKSVSASASVTAAIKTDGTLWLWGANGGNLGDNTTAYKSSPIQTIAGGTNWIQISAGLDASYGLKTDGTLWGWGDNSQGQLGDNTTIAKSSPVQTITGSDWVNVFSSYWNMGAIKSDGTLWTCGYNNWGQLGDNTIVKRSSPVQRIAGGTKWISGSCSSDNMAAIYQEP